MTVILDLNGVARDEAWLYAKYGAKIARAGSTARLVLTHIQETTGTMIHQIHVQDERGNPLPNYQVGLHWDAAPINLHAPVCEPYKTKDPSPVAIQSTNGAGDTGYELGSGGFSPGAPDGGPHGTLVLSDKYESDALINHGWRAMTNHEQCGRLTFTLVTGASTPDPDPDPEDPPVTGDLAAVVAELREIKALIKAGFRL